MSTLSTFGPGNGSGRSGRTAIRAGLAALIHGLAREREIRRSMRELRSLDDRMLHDIGLTRGDIERAVRFGRD
jgi:uncharacterized protein YjiS (DUF1127 family)